MLQETYGYNIVKGIVLRDFRPTVFFMNHLPSVSLTIIVAPYRIFLKFATPGALPVSKTLVVNWKSVYSKQTVSLYSLYCILFKHYW